MILTTSIDKFKKIYFLPVLLFHLILLANTKFTLWPEMVVYPYLLNNGFILYRDLINPYLPTLTYVLSIYTKLFGYSPENFRTLTWVCILAIDALIFKVSLMLSKNYFKATLSLLFFTLMSMPLYINGLWFDLIQTPFIVLSIYNFYRFLRTKNKKNIQAAFFWDLIAVFIKQQALWLIIFYLITLVYIFRGKSLNVIKATIPVIILFGAVFGCFALIFANEHVLEEFFFWTIYFPFFKASSQPGYILFPTPKQIIFVLFLFAIFLPAIRAKSKYRIFVLGALTTTLFAYPRFDYFHLIPSLSILSLIVGETLFDQIKGRNAVKVLLLSSFAILSIFSYKYFISNWTQEIRFFETDILSSATFLSLITNPKDPIYVQNGPDQLLPLAKRLPPKPWATQFPWYLELNNYQKKVIDGINNTDTKFIVFKPYENKEKFDLGTYKPVLVASYINANYHNYIKISDSLWLKVKN